MIKSFHDKGTEDIFNRINSNESRRTCPQGIIKVAQRKLDQINAVTKIESLLIPPGNRLEQLNKDRAGQYSIRINEQYRICFNWTDDGAENVEITDYH